MNDTINMDSLPQTPKPAHHLKEMNSNLESLENSIRVDAKKMAIKLLNRKFNSSKTTSASSPAQQQAEMRQQAKSPYEQE